MTVEGVKQIIRNEIAGQQAYADSTAANAGFTTPREHHHTAGVLRVMLHLIEFLESQDRVATQVSPPTPQRELVGEVIRGVRDRLTASGQSEDYNRGVCDACNDSLELLYTGKLTSRVSPPTPEPIIYVMLNGHGGVIGATFDEAYAQANTNYITAIQIGPLSSPPPEPGDKR